MKYKFLEHTADIKFQAFGKTIEEMFENSALAMFDSMYDGKRKETKKFRIIVQGSDLENLLYNFLEELLFLLDSEDFFLSKIKKIEVDEKKLEVKAEVFGDNAKDYDIHIDVKAITYNEMFVKKEKNQWISQVVLDV